MWFDHMFTGREWSQFTRPCVYAWFSNDRCLYVGSSTKGIARVLNLTHHVLGLKATLLPNDEIKLFFPPIMSEKELRDVERLYIRKLAPLYNIAHNQRVNVTEANQNALSFEQELEQILFGEGKDAKTKEQIEVRLAEVKRAARMFALLGKS